MAEYFELSILGFNSSKIDDLKSHLTSKDGKKILKNNLPFVGNRYALFDIIDNEILISIENAPENKIFQKDKFDNQKAELEKLFKMFSDILNPNYILASFEMNTYLLNKVENLEHLDNALLSRFPFVYKKTKLGYGFKFNLNAQNIF